MIVRLAAVVVGDGVCRGGRGFLVVDLSAACGDAAIDVVCLLAFLVIIGFADRLGLGLRRDSVFCVYLGDVCLHRLRRDNVSIARCYVAGSEFGDTAAVQGFRAFWINLQRKS